MYLSIFGKGLKYKGLISHVSVFFFKLKGIYACLRVFSISIVRFSL